MANLFQEAYKDAQPLLFTILPAAILGELLHGFVPIIPNPVVDLAFVLGGIGIANHFVQKNKQTAFENGQRNPIVKK